MIRKNKFLFSGNVYMYTYIGICRIILLGTFIWNGIEYIIIMFRTSYKKHGIVMPRRQSVKWRRGRAETFYRGRVFFHFLTVITYTELAESQHNFLITNVHPNASLLTSILDNSDRSFLVRFKAVCVPDVRSNLTLNNDNYYYCTIIIAPRVPTAQF